MVTLQSKFECGFKHHGGTYELHSTRSADAEWIVKRRREWMILGQDVDNEVLIGIKMIPLAHQKSYVVKILAEPTDG